MKAPYLNKSLFGLIPLVGIIIVGVYLISFGISDAILSLKMSVNAIMMTAGIWIGCMTIVNILWIKFPWEEKPFLHLIIEFFSILTYTLLFSFLMYRLEKKFWNLPEMDNIGMQAFMTILITFFITAVYESVFFYRQWKYNFSKSVRLEKEHLEAKYEALMAQINPHFLFNSLNGLASMVGENKPVVDYIENLSTLLRYMMKSGEKELVLLSEELEILRCYISIHLARFNGSLEIAVDIPDSLYNNAIPPLVLQMLVENCMKHNVMSIENPLRVKIVAEHDSITVINNIHKKSGVISTGLGLENIRARYGFFTSTLVEVSDNDGIFKVKIPLLQAEL
jgi:two-component system, LytTR family, sensor kinase